LITRRLTVRSICESTRLLKQLHLGKPLLPSRWLPLKLAIRSMASKGPKSSKGTGSGGSVLIPSVTIKVIPARPPPKLGYDDRNMMLGREMSPHLTIYKPQLTSILSIFLRISGFALTIFAWGLGIVGLVYQGDMDGLIKKVEGCDCGKILTAIKVIVALPFAYHVVAGTRHMIWLLNMFTTLPEIYATGYVAVALSALLGLGLIKMKSGEKVTQEVVDLTKKGKEKAKKAAPKKAEPKKKDAKADPKKDGKGK
ncbi:hypothetical protein KR018_000630, partial [Drosophila ironensis]